MSHNELADKLAERLRHPGRMVWTDLQLGPQPSPRPDVYTLNKSFKHPSPRVYEVKVSVSDFRADVTAGKWQRYLEFSCAVTFVVPAGLIKKDDVPKGCGLMTLSERGWATVRRPTLQTCELPSEALLKLLIDAHDTRRIKLAHRVANEWTIAEKHRKALGDRVADILVNIEAAERRITSSHEEAARIRARAIKQRERADADAQAESRKAVEYIYEAFELTDAEIQGSFGLASAVRERLDRLNTDAEVKRLQRALRSIERALGDAKHPMREQSSRERSVSPEAR